MKKNQHLSLYIYIGLFFFKKKKKKLTAQIVDREFDKGGSEIVKVSIIPPLLFIIIIEFPKAFKY